jgi:hypothetical protein
MTSYIIVELEDGLSVIELPDGQNPEDVAITQGGVLVDEGPFATLEEANDAIDNLGVDEEQT